MQRMQRTHRTHALPGGSRERLSCRIANAFVLHRTDAPSFLNRSVKAPISATEFGNECYRYLGARDSVEWDTNPGGRYEIQIDRFPQFVAATPAELELVFVSAPVNDTPAGAIALEGFETSLTLTNTGSTRRP